MNSKKYVNPIAHPLEIFLLISHVCIGFNADIKTNPMKRNIPTVINSLPKYKQEELLFKLEEQTLKGI